MIYDEYIEINTADHDGNIILITPKDNYKSIFYKFFIRFQEHYESPEFRNKIFTLGQLRHWYSNVFKRPHSVGWSYGSDWGGWNFPSYIMEPFKSGLFDPLTMEERVLVDLLRHKEGKFYVIGAASPSHVLHEIAHAMYYINEDYRKAVDLVLKNYNSNDELGPMMQELEEAGYHPDVLMDEIHAYHMELENDKKFEGFVPALAEDLQSIRMKYINKCIRPAFL